MTGGPVSAPERDARMAGSHPPRVLLAQSDADSLTIFAMALRKGGIEPVLARSGEDAIRAVVAESPDLILLGLRLRMVDGWRVLEVLKDDPTSTQAPVIALTADARMSTRRKALKAGFADVWTKPIHPMELLERVRSRLGRS